MFTINQSRIDIERARKGITQKELAKNAGVGLVTLTAKKLSPVSIGKIAKALDIDVEELIIHEEVK